MLGLALIPLVFLLLVAGIFWRLEADTQAATAWAQHSDDVIEQSQRLQNDLGNAGGAVRRFVRSGSPEAERLFREAAAAAPADARRLRDLVVDNASQSQIALDLSALTSRMTGNFETLMTMMGHGARRAVFSSATADAIKTQDDALDDQLRAEFGRFEAAEKDLVAARRGSSLNLWNVFRWVTLGATVSGVLVALTLGLTIGRRVVSRLRRLQEQAKGADGIVPVPIEGDDEIADVSRTLREMAGEIRERNESLERYNDALERYRLLAEQATDAILFLHREDASILEANRAAVEMYGYSMSELLSMTAYDLRAVREEPARDRLIPASGPVHVTLQTLHRRKDGTTFPVEASNQSAYLKGGHLILCVIRDIAERDAAESAVRAALAQATEASRLKSEFVATMSHEIRTPLNGVIGMTELLLDSPMNAEQHEFALTARDSAHSLLGIINNILDFSKIEAGKIEREVTEFDLIAKVESIGSMLGAAARKKNISLMTYVDPSIPQRLLGDALRLRQVLVNLTGNAVKFTSEGGVSLTVDPVSLEAESVGLRFSVRDTGIGIAPESLPRLFEAFHQADGSTTRRYGGTGLGLAISKHLVEVMGGDLHVESEVGRGSTFSFQLGFHAAQPAVASVRHDFGSLRAIVIDDDVMSRDIFSRYATSWGVATSVAGTAEEGLAMMRESSRKGQPFGLALVDLRMPEMDGLQLATAVKADPALSATRLLLVTAYDGPRQGEEAIRAGFSAYLTKPVRQSQLYDAIVGSVYGHSKPAATGATSLEPAMLHGERILLVEDNEVNRQVFLRQLERLGYRAEYASDGREALERIAKEGFDLVFMDCQMPVMDGFQSARAIRKMETRTGQHVPIIALTANALAGDRDDCMAAGMDDYLSKPAGLSDISRILARWLSTPSVMPAALNTRRLAEIFGSDPTEIVAFLAAAIATIRERCERLAAASSRAEVLELAHDVKGAAGNLGAEELASAAAEVEATLKSSDGDMLPSFDRIASAFERLERAANGLRIEEPT